MASSVYSVPYPLQDDWASLEFYLQAAAKIVETVAFEIAPQTSSATVEELLKLACGIERAVDDLRQNA